MERGHVDRPVGDDGGADLRHAGAVGGAEYRNFAHAPESHHRRLERIRADLGPAAVDHFVHAPGEPQEAVGREHPAIAGIHEACAEHGGGGLRVVEISARVLLAADTHDAFLSGRDGPVVFIDDLNLHARVRVSRYSRVATRDRRRRPGHAAGLGQPVADDDIRAHPLACQFVDVRRQHTAGHFDRLQRIRAPLRGQRLGHLLQEDRRRHDIVDARTHEPRCHPGFVGARLDDSATAAKNDQQAAETVR